MARNCSIAVVVWVALVGGYFYWLRRVLGMPELAIVSVIAATAVWIGFAWIFGTRHQVREWRARNRAASGQRPVDGDVTTVVGTIHPSFEPLKAALSGRDCVLYTYDAGGPRHGDQPSARVFVGFGMTRCAIRTPFGEFFLGSFPVLNGFGKEDVDREQALSHLRTAPFEAANLFELAKRMMKMHADPPPLRHDWKLGESHPDFEDMTSFEECVIPTGTTVTAIGRYSGGANALVSDTKDKGFLRLFKGAQEIKAQAVPWGAIGAFFGGIVVIAAANAILWFALEKLRS